MFTISRYFEGGVSSVYLWDLDHGFAGVILIKKGKNDGQFFFLNIQDIIFIDNNCYAFFGNVLNCEEMLMIID